MATTEAVESFLQTNAADLRVLGLLFCRLLDADFLVLSKHPSPTLMAVLGFDEKKILGTKKPILELISEWRATGEEPLTDGHGDSVLRL